MSNNVIDIDFDQRNQIEDSVRAALKTRRRGAAKETLSWKKVAFLALRNGRIAQSLFLDLAVSIRVDQLRFRDSDDEILRKNLTPPQLEEVSSRADLLVKRTQLTGAGCE